MRFERARRQKYTITWEQIWKIRTNAEKQGGLKQYAYDTNKILDVVEEEKEW